MSKVPDTTKEHPLGMLLRAMAHSEAGNDPSQAIYDQEARGQSALVKSTQLPVEGSPGHYRYGKEDADLDAGWAATGIEFSDPEGDNIFRDAKLPGGWKKQATGHSMWSDLVDDKGRKRAALFYKAAFYDRSAHMDLCKRFRIEKVYGTEGYIAYEADVTYSVTDGGEEVIFTTETRTHEVTATNESDRETTQAWWDEDKEIEAGLIAECKAWLNEHYPQWESYAGHWD